MVVFESSCMMVFVGGLVTWNNYDSMSFWMMMPVAERGMSESANAHAPKMCASKNEQNRTTDDFDRIHSKYS